MAKKGKGKKKGSGKKSKVDKMSEEDRVIYMETKKLEEEEKRKQREDESMQYLKMRLQIEENNAKFNLHKLNNQWRELMRVAKSKELKKDIQILSQTFERVVDRKHAVIKSLLQDLEEAEEQYAMALRRHLQNIDRLIDLQKSRVSTLQEEYEDELEILKSEFDAERKNIIDQNKIEINDLQDVLFAMEQNFQEKENEMKGEFQSLRDEIKNKNLEEKHALRVALESIVEDYWKQFSAALNNYKETTEQRKKQFEELKEKDEKSSKVIELQMAKIQKIQEQISQYRFRLAGNSKETDLRNSKIKTEKDIIYSQYMELKSQMNAMREKERENLTKLSVESKDCKFELERKIQKAEQILKLGEMARRLETEEEKVLPFFTSSLTQDEQKDINEAYAEEPSEDLAKMMHDFNSLEIFWKRYNKVLIDDTVLQKEQSLLQEENQKLRLILKQYLDGISVNDEILSHVNPLFIVNQKSNVKVPTYFGQYPRHKLAV